MVYRFVATIFLLAAFCSALACRKDAATTPTKEYLDSVREETLSAFYVGLAALEVGDDARAEEKLKRVIELLPQDAAGWANAGLLALRRKEYATAETNFTRARELAPANSDIQLLSGQLESLRGDYAKAIAYLRKAVELQPQNLHAIYLLAQELERQNDAKAIAEAQSLLQKAYDAHTENLALLVEVMRLAAKRSDTATLQNGIAQLAAQSSRWSKEVQESFASLQAAASASDTNQIATRLTFLQNALQREMDYRRSLAEIQPPIDRIGEPLTKLFYLPAPAPAPAPPDEGTRFVAESPKNFNAGKPTGQAAWAGAMFLTADWKPSVVIADGKNVKTNNVSLPFPGGASSIAPSPDGLAALDFNYDFKTDIAMAGAGGFLLYRQDSETKFTDATAKTALDAAILNAAYYGVWAFDVESDGDLDILLAAQNGATRLLQNNGDGTFTALDRFASVTRLRQFVAADVDGDGDSDALMLDAQGWLFVFTNERLGDFRKRETPQNLNKIAAIAAADANHDGVMDAIAMHSDGKISALLDQSEGKDWQTAALAQWMNFRDELASDNTRLLVADFDNNGGFDLLATSTSEAQIWLSDEQGAFQTLESPLPPSRIFAVAELTDDGRLDLLGLSEKHEPVQLTNRGQREYQWKAIRTRAKQTQGDQRINPFGIGSEIEMRAALLYQKQIVVAPVTHFGLGKHLSADVVRIVWPNGSVQAEFELRADVQATAPALFDQRLEGSCPFVFANDGQRLNFIKDFIWRSPLGLRINAQDTASVMQTEDWIRIDGAQLAALDGFYDLRITAELWETHFFDHVSLMVVDHPVGTEIFVDERFSTAPPALAVHTFAPPQAVLRAVDDNGQNVSEIVKRRDGTYLDTFGRGQYQGVTRNHYVEIELPKDAPSNGNLWLIASGWIHPTDSSINVALAQAKGIPQSLSLEVQDNKGNWATAQAGLGFPEGKQKTILLNLDNIFRPDAPRRLRLRTNLEIYWDAIEWAVALPDAQLDTTRIAATTADLHYRGFSFKSRADESSPELPDYERLASTVQRRRDLIGYHTRFGDVRELLATTDDRYVIMNAGDEMTFRFAAPPAPPAGFVRDFVLIGDGWVKDGNYNTTFSKTVLPLPAHNRPDYTTAPKALEDDPVYRQHADDWKNFHTRYVSARSFQNPLRVR